jgi:hypothetical protein
MSDKLDSVNGVPWPVRNGIGVAGIGVMLAVSQWSSNLSASSPTTKRPIHVN